MATFEDRLTALEAVVERLEQGELPLEESVRLFEEGVQLSNACKAELDSAEGRIQVLVQRRGKGRLEDLEMEEDAEDEGKPDTLGGPDDLQGFEGEDEA